MRRCPLCHAPLSRKDGESAGEFRKRVHCGYQCLFADTMYVGNKVGQEKLSPWRWGSGSMRMTENMRRKRITEALERIASR